jgi:glycosyltransferase involved in cell wall biosynthesis
VCGENFRRVPAEFEWARENLGERIVQWGRVEPWEAYIRLLWEADIVVSTAVHDFFGAAVVEAIACGCRPVLPKRLAYPEHIPREQWSHCLYADFDELLERLEQAIREPNLNLQAAVARYDWDVMANQYDVLLAAVG